jgi:putative Mg2+ transporter-C (MgtC) family protein
MGFGDITVWEIAIRLLVAPLLGALLGLDREAKDKPAGLRTYALIALGASSFTLSGLFFLDQWSGGDTVQLDLMRLISGLVGGIGFLGAGAIIQSQGDVKGMTTAASIWVVAAIGLACGAGAYVIAGLTVLLTYLILAGLYVVKRRLGSESSAAND